MKHKYSIFLLGVFVFASQTIAAPITRQQALQQVQAFLQQKGKNIRIANLRHAPRRKGITTSDKEPYYIFNVGNDEGFVVASGDDRTISILGYSNSGNFDAGQIPENMREWLRGYEQQIKALDSIKGLTSALLTSRAPIQPLIKTKWGQNTPYNNLCPMDGNNRSITGCVATAMAQVMNYHRWPQNETTSIPAYTTETRGLSVEALGPTQFNWSLMKDDYKGIYNDDEANAVAKLMRYCGQAVKMDYTANASGANVSGAQLIDYFGYSKNTHVVRRDLYTSSVWEDLIYNELANNRPVLYAGFNRSYSSGHEFVCDGCDGNGYYHFNWGWNGYCDDYFVLSVLDPGGTDFSYRQIVIIGMEPPQSGEIIRPFILANAMSSENKELTRTTEDADFPSFRVSSEFHNYHYTFTGKMGFGIYKNDKLVRPFLSNSIVSLEQDYYFSNFSVNIVFDGKLTEGEYDIRPIYQSSGDETIYVCDNQSQKATISGKKLYIEEYDNTTNGFKVNSINFNGEPYKDVAVQLTINITNTGKGNTQEFYVKLGTASVMVSSNMESGKSGDVKVSITPKESGSQALSVVYAGETLWSTMIDVRELHDYDMSGIIIITNSISGYEQYVSDTTIETAIQISNRSNYAYNNDIEVRLYSADGQLETTKTIPVNINAGATITANTQFINLRKGETYRLVAYYRNPGSTSSGDQGIKYLAGITVRTYVHDYNLKSTLITQNVVQEVREDYTYIKGDRLELTLEVENTDDYDFVGTLKFYLSDYTDGFSTYDNRTVTIPAHGKVSLDYTFTGIKTDVSYWVNAYISGLTMKTLLSHFFKSVEGGLVLQRDISATVKIETTLPEDPSWIYIPGNTLEGVATLTNNGGQAYNDTILVILQGRNYLEQKILVSIDAGKTIDVPFNFTNLLMDQDYGLKIKFKGTDGEYIATSTKQYLAQILTNMCIYNMTAAIDYEDWHKNFSSDNREYGNIYGSTIKGTLHITNNSERAYENEIYLTLRSGTETVEQKKLSIVIGAYETNDLDFEFDNLQTDKAYALNASYYEWGMYRKGSYGRTAKAATMDVYKYVTLKGGEEPTSPIIQFADAEVKRICVENWDTDGDGELSEEEAAAVTDLAGVFKHNASITSFDELRYFTGLTTIPSYSFNECNALKQISIPQGVKTINYGAMAQCNKLEKVELPNSLVTMGKHVFYDCPTLKQIILPESLTEIGSYTFQYCSSLQNIDIPAGVTSIGDNPFLGCKALITIDVAEGNMAYDSRNNCNGIIETATNKLITGTAAITIPSTVIIIGPEAFRDLDIQTITIPDGITTIDELAFYNCSSLTSVTIPNSVSKIGDYAFGGCSGLTSVTIPNSVTDIGQGAFADCTNLEMITIGKNVNIIQDWAFCDNKKIKEVYVLNPVPVAISDNVFHTETIWNEDGSFNTTKDFTTATLYVPYGCKTAYQAAAGWKNFQNIVEMEPDFRPGDLNGDDFVNGTDLVALVSVIMGQDEQTKVADVNADGLVNGTDYVALVDLILNEGNAPVKAYVGHEDKALSEATISIEPFRMENAHKGTLTITLDNPDMAVTMLQLDLTLPRGLRLQHQGEGYAVAMTGRTTWKDHSVYASHLEGELFRLMLASAQNATVKDTEGGILRLSLVADDDFDGGEVVIDNILCTSPSLQECRPQAFRAYLNKDNTTGIGEMRTVVAEGKSYTIAGQRVSNPRKGLYVIDGKKRIAR